MMMPARQLYYAQAKHTASYNHQPTNQPSIYLSMHLSLLLMFLKEVPLEK